jgi:hypothetical protein
MTTGNEFLLHRILAPLAFFLKKRQTKQEMMKLKIGVQERNISFWMQLSSLAMEILKM